MNGVKGGTGCRGLHGELSILQTQSQMLMAGYNHRFSSTARKLEMRQDGRRQVVRPWFSQDKGHRVEWETFVEVLRGKSALPIPFTEIVATSLTSFSIIHSLNSLNPCKVSTEKPLID